MLDVALCLSSSRRFHDETNTLVVVVVVIKLLSPFEKTHDNPKTSDRNRFLRARAPFSLSYHLASPGLLCCGCISCDHGIQSKILFAWHRVHRGKTYLVPLQDTKWGPHTHTQSSITSAHASRLSFLSEPTRGFGMLATLPVPNKWRNYPENRRRFTRSTKGPWKAILHESPSRGVEDCDDG